MIKTISVCAELFHYGVLLLFGVFVTAAFLGVFKARRDIAALTSAGVCLIIIQFVFYIIFDEHLVRQIYPLIVHLPLLLFFVFYYKKSLFSTALSLSITYLCCQIVHWLEVVAWVLNVRKLLIELVASVLLAVLAFLLVKYFAKPISELLYSDRKSLFVFGIIPFVYYIYDYISAVYTDLLHSANLVTVEFFPFIICLAYLMFGLIYFHEYESRIVADWHAQMLKVQYEAIQSRMEETRRARHDLRQHIRLIQAYIDKGDKDALQDYIRSYGQTLPEDTGSRYCENAVADTIIRFYAQKAAEEKVAFESMLNLPTELNISEPDLCVLFGNLLENALEECTRHENELCSIKISGQLRGSRTLIITVDNTPAKEPEYLDGILLSSKIKGREGTGTLSIKEIASRYKGEANFE